MNYPRWLIGGLYALTGVVILTILLVTFFTGFLAPPWLLGPAVAVPFMLASYMYTNRRKKSN